MDQTTTVTPDTTPAADVMPASGPSDYQRYAEARRAGTAAPAVGATDAARDVVATDAVEAPVTEPPAPVEKVEPKPAPTGDEDLVDEEPADEETPEEREQRQSRNRSRNQRRISAAMRRQHKAEFEAEQLRKRVAELESKQQQPADPNAPPATPAKEVAPADASSADGLVEPKEEDFERYSDYVKALTAHTLAVKDAAAQAERIAAEERARSEEAARAFTTRQETARAKYADFDAVVLQPLPLNAAMVHVIQTRDAGPEIAYHLGKHPEECARIAALSGVDAVVELGRLEAQLTGTVKPTAPARAARPTTSAPAPLTPVGGSATPSTTPMGKLSYQEYKEKRLAQGRK
jgi:hypothetical protein